MKFEKQIALGGFDIITLNSPNFDELTKTEKRLLLLPLVDTIRDFYKDPLNRAKYEKWKRDKETANL